MIIMRVSRSAQFSETGIVTAGESDRNPEGLSAEAPPNVDPRNMACWRRIVVHVGLVCLTCVQVSTSVNFPKIPATNES